MALWLMISVINTHAFQADARSGMSNVVFYSATGVPAPTNRVIWFVADLNRDGVPTSPLEGKILGADDKLIFVDTLDGTLLGEQPGKHQRLNISVPEEYTNADVYVYLWNVPVDQAVGQAGQKFAVRSLGVRPPPKLGNADWSVTAPMVADQYQVRSNDADGDGLPDKWEIAHFGAIDDPRGTPDLDPDADGLNNLAEWAAGTDPLDAQSGLRILSLDRVGSEWRIGFSSVSGKVYRVECCDDLVTANWQPLTNAVTGQGTVTEIRDAALGDPRQRFYRVRLTGP